MRFLALFLVFTLSLPHSAFALRPREPEPGTPVHAGLEEALRAGNPAQISRASFPAAGLEEGLTRAGRILRWASYTLLGVILLTVKGDMPNPPVPIEEPVLSVVRLDNSKVAVDFERLKGDLLNEKVVVPPMFGKPLDDVLLEKDMDKLLSSRERIDLHKILGESQILLMEDDHAAPETKNFLKEHLVTLQGLSAKYVAMEMIPASYQDDLNTWDLQAQRRVKAHLRINWDKGPGIVDLYMGLISESKKIGLTVVGIEDPNDRNSGDRVKVNSYWAEKIQSSLSSDKAAKMVVFCGAGHLGPHSASVYGLLRQKGYSLSVVEFAGYQEEKDLANALAVQKITGSPPFLQEQVTIETRRRNLTREGFMIKRGTDRNGRNSYWIIHLPHDPKAGMEEVQTRITAATTRYEGLFKAGTAELADNETIREMNRLVDSAGIESSRKLTLEIDLNQLAGVDSEAIPSIGKLFKHVSAPIPNAWSDLNSELIDESVTPEQAPHVLAKRKATANDFFALSPTVVGTAVGEWDAVLRSGNFQGILMTPAMVKEIDRLSQTPQGRRELAFVRAAIRQAGGIVLGFEIQEQAGQRKLYLYA